MKIEINSQPVFNLPLPIGTILLLMEMSAHHYDGVCKSAGMVGGFIYGWRNCVSFAPDLPVSATWRELDTMLKICENTGIFSDRPDEKQIIRGLAKAVRYAMSQWNQKSSGFCLSLDSEDAGVAQ